MPLSEKLRCRYAYEHLPVVDQKLHAIETQGWEALDFDSKMASGGDRIGAVEWARHSELQSLEWVHLDLVGCPDPKNSMGKRQESECNHYREQLKRDQERLADLEERGDEAVRAYDLRMGYDAEFNKQLKRNHIIYDLKQLERCPKPLMEMAPAVPVAVSTPTVQEPRSSKESAAPMTGYKQESLF